MIAISVLVPALIAQTKTPWQQIAFVVKQSRIRILIISLKIFGMLIVAAILDFELILCLPKLHFLPLRLTVNTYYGEGLAIAAVFFAAVAWLIVPNAPFVLFRLLANSRPQRQSVCETQETLPPSVRSARLPSTSWRRS